MALTTSQLTFYDMIDDEISFAIYSEGISDNKITLRAIVTKQGAELDGDYVWYSNADSFMDPVGATPQLQKDVAANEVLRCDFSYLNSENVAYTAYFNITNSRMVYTSRPESGEYLAGDLWYVGSDYVATDADGNVVTTESTTTYSNVLLVAQNAGGGTYKSTDWVLATDYGEKFGEYDEKFESIENTTGGLAGQINTLELWKGNMSNFVSWTEDGGLQFTGRNENGTDGNFIAQLTSDKLIFLFRDDTNKGYIETAWIGGENVEGDSHPQFFVNDATVASTLNVNGLLSCQNFMLAHPQSTKASTLVLQPEANGSFSIVVGKK